MCVCVCICAYVCVYVCIYVRACVCECVCVCVHACVRMCVDLSVRAYVCVCVCERERERERERKRERERERERERNKRERRAGVGGSGEEERGGSMAADDWSGIRSISPRSSHHALSEHGAARCEAPVLTLPLPPRHTKKSLWQVDWRTVFIHAAACFQPFIGCANATADGGLTLLTIF